MVWRGRPSGLPPNDFITGVHSSVSECINCRPSSSSSSSWRDKHADRLRVMYITAAGVQRVRSAIFLQCDFLHRWFALLWKKDYLRKTTCDWLCGYDAAFVKLLWPLVPDSSDSVLVQFLSDSWASCSWLPRVRHLIFPPYLGCFFTFSLTF